MKDFIYNVEEKIDLNVSSCDWLTETGLLETQWFLDTEWLLKHTTFKQWITWEK